MARAKRHHQVLGGRGEELAVAYMQAKQLIILDRNWRCALGEVDIVAADGSTLVMCEVKTRSSQRFGSPLEAITASKAIRMQRVGFAWCKHHQANASNVRFDVVSIIDPGVGQPHIEHHLNVV